MLNYMGSVITLWVAGAAFAGSGEGGIPRGNWPLGIESGPTYGDSDDLTDEAIALGRSLFFDVRLSRDSSLSCASCHRPQFALSDSTPISPGIMGGTGIRNTPTIVNRILGRTQFWDGRAASLELQALGPLFNASEMGMTRELLIERISQDPDYVRQFGTIYGSRPSVELAAKALASFEASLLSGDSPFDRFEWGGDVLALSEAAQRGLRLFRGKARCSTCHVGTNFTDERFHATGAGQDEGKKDPGRMSVTGDERDFGKFKTPTLRNVALSAPYMHDGSMRTLEEVVDFYDRGGNESRHLDLEMRPLLLTAEERKDIKQFLLSLSGAVVSVPASEIVRIRKSD